MTPAMNTEEIIRLIAKFHLVPYDEIVAKTRGTLPVVTARYHAIRTVNEMKPHLSSTELGRVFNRHHATILHALNRLKRKPTV